MLQMRIKNQLSVEISDQMRVEYKSWTCNAFEFILNNCIRDECVSSIGIKKGIFSKIGVELKKNIQFSSHMGDIAIRDIRDQQISYEWKRRRSSV